MTDRLHTCPAPALSRVGFRSAPFRPVPPRCAHLRPGRAQFHNFCTPDPIWSKTCSDLGSNLHAQTVKSYGFAAEGC